jgi:peroxiredoxin
MTKQLLTLMAIAGLVAIGFTQLGSSADRDTAPKKIANFTLKDPRAAKNVGLADFKDKKAVVVIFLGTECPISNGFLPRLAQVHKDYAGKGVQVVGINSNSQDTPESVADRAGKNDLPFPVLKDESSAVADQFGAKRTPEAFVLDAERTVRYQGRIDDQFGYGFKRAQPTRRDLLEALDEVLAGKPVAVASTPVAGCVISRTITPKTEGAITYSNQVVRILQKNCQECHRPGQIGPFSLLTYRQAVAWSETIREVIQDQRMPPWYADPKHGKFSNDRSLSAAERETVLAWIDQGCPKGDDKAMPPRREFAEGWTIGQPDAIFTMAKAFEVPADSPKGGIPYQYFSVETNLTEDKWVERAEARGGAGDVVHHIVVFIQPPGVKFDQRQEQGVRILCGTAPGDMPFIAPAGAAKKIPAGSKLIFQMHYTPSGKPASDKSSVAVIYAKKPVERRVNTFPIVNHKIQIPAGDDNYPLESEFTFKEDGSVLSFMPHMHLRGKDFKYEAIYPDGKREVLLSVPRYNFNWQSVYRLAEAKVMPKGTKIHCTAHFDNSTKNPNNPDPTQLVRWGDQTWEEMMIGWMDMVYGRPAN